MTFPAINNLKSQSRKISLPTKGKLWDKFLKIYSPVLTEAILQLSPDREIANQILTEVFYKVRDIRFWTKQWKPICLSLLQHTYHIAMKHLQVHETLPGSGSSEYSPCPAPQAEVSKSHALQDNAVATGVPMRQIPRNLQIEITRYKKEGKLTPPSTSLSQFHSFLKTFYNT